MAVGPREGKLCEKAILQGAGLTEGEVPGVAGAHQSGNKKTAPGQSPAGANHDVAMATSGAEHLGRGLWVQARALKAKLLEAPEPGDCATGDDQQRGWSGSLHKASTR